MRFPVRFGSIRPFFASVAHQLIIVRLVTFITFAISTGVNSAIFFFLRYSKKRRSFAAALDFDNSRQNLVTWSYLNHLPNIIANSRASVTREFH